MSALDPAGHETTLTAPPRVANRLALRLCAAAAAALAVLLASPGLATDHHVYAVLPVSQANCPAAGGAWDGSQCVSLTPADAVSAGDRVRWVLGLGAGAGALGSSATVGDTLAGGSLIGGTLLVPSALNSGWTGGSLPALASWSAPGPVVEGPMAFNYGANELWAFPNSAAADGNLDRVLVVPDPALQVCGPAAGADGLAWGTLSLSLPTTASGTVTLLTNNHGGLSTGDETTLSSEPIPGGQASFSTTSLPALRSFKIWLTLSGISAADVVPTLVTFANSAGAPQICFDSTLPATCPSPPLNSFTLTGAGGPVDVTGGLGGPVTCLDALSISPTSPGVAPLGSLAFSASGGRSPYTFSLLANASGATLSSAGAYKAGSTGNVSDTVEVSDSLGNTASTTVHVAAGVTISPATASVAPHGAQAFTASGGSGTGFAWSLSTNASGGTINASTGAYTAGAAGGVTDVVQVTDSLGNTASRNVTVGAGVTLSPATLSVAPRGTQTFTASGGSGPYTFSLQTNASGGTINASTGAYAAGPTGNVSDVVRVVDSLANADTSSVTVTAGVTISPATASVAPHGAQTFTASGGSGTGFAWSLSTNASGGTINASTGAYTAGAAGGVTDVVQVNDSLGNTASRNVTVGAGVTLSPTSLSVAPRGTQTFTASGGSGPYTFSLQTNASGGTINASTGAYTAGPTGNVSDVVRVVDSLANADTSSVTVTAGVTISPATASVAPRGAQAFTASGGSGTGFAWSLSTNASGGTINGSTGAYTAGPTGGVSDVVHVTDSLGNTASRNVTVGAGVTLSPATLSVAPRGTQTFTASGGSGPYTFSLQTNASGGTINASTGAYTAGPAGNVSDVVRVVDSLANADTSSVTVTAGVTISPATASVAPHGAQTFTASGGSGTGFAWSLSTNASGGTINASTGAYTAGAAGGVTDVVQVNDSLGNTASRNVTVGAGVTLSPTSLSVAPRGTQTFTASGGSGPYTFSLQTNASGGTINASTGAYTAGPAGNVSDTVEVSDSLGNTASTTVHVAAGVTISPATASVAPHGAQAFTASGGSGTGFAWSLSTNASGGTINASTGAYTAGAAGGVTDVVRVTDSLGNTASRNVTVGAGVTLSPTSLSVAPRGTQTFTASGGSGPYTFSLQTNASGGTINASTGAYTAGPAGNVSDVVRVVDSLANADTTSVTVTAGVTISPATASVAPRGAQAFTASGGSGTGFAWSLSTNASGGTINASTGAYTAGPTGGVSDVVRVVDSLGNADTSSVTVTAGVTISPATASVAPHGALGFTASGGSGTGFTWSLSTNASGGSINASTGAYAAGATGGVTDVVRVVDSLGSTASRNVTVSAGVSISPTNATVAPRGTQTFTASGGSGTGYAFSLSGNASGGTIGATTGAYTAGPTGGVTDVVQVTDSLGNLAITSVTVGAAVTISPASGNVAPRGLQTFAASGGSGTGFTWSLPTNASGGSINASTGAYAAGATGGVSDVVRVVDSLGNTATASVTVAAGISIVPATATVAPRGAQAFTASGGGGGGFIWSLSANASGGSIGATSGAYVAGPTGGVTDVVHVTDSLGNTASRNVTVTAGVSISPATASVAPRGTQAFSASGGSGTGFTWSLTAAPSGGSITAGGSYTAGATGGVTDVVQVTDSLGNVASRNVAVGAGVVALPATATVAPRGIQAFTASGGSGAGFVWSLSTSASGGSITAGGLYTAGATGGVTDVVRVTDSLGNFDTSSVTVTAGISIAPATASAPPRGTLSFAASGGSGTGFAWSLATNASGGAINASSGVYTAGAVAGTTDVVQATDSLGNVATRNVAVTAGVAIAPGALGLPPGATHTFAASGGSGTGFAWSLATNASGGSINASTGAYRAGPAGSVTDVVRVTDSLGNAATATVTVTSSLSITASSTTAPPRGLLAFTGAGGSGVGFTWSLATNASGGAIVAATGAYTAGPVGGVTDVVLLADSLGNTATLGVTVTAGVVVAPATASVAPRGSRTFTASGGSGAGFTWALATNASGATIVATTGVYTAGAIGGVTDVVQVTDSLGNVASRNVAVGTGVALLPATATLAPRGTQAFAASGGSGTGYAWSLPTNASGGSITAAGVYRAGAAGGVTDVVRVADSLGNFATGTVTVTAGVSIAPASASVPPRGSVSFTASGGSGTGFTWSLAAAPSGGTINPSTGVYTAGAAGVVTDVVVVTDSLGNTATSNVSVTSRVTLNPPAATVAPRGSQAFTASGGSGTGFTWSLATNASGGTIVASSGVYTAGATGGVVDVVQATDSLGNTATRNVTVTAGLAIGPATASVPPLGSQAFTATGGSGTGLVWSLVASPSGGAIGGATGAYLAGPVGGVTDVVQVTDSLGNTATRDVSVAAGVTIAPATASAPPRSSLAFTATGGSGTGFTWSLATNASGGTIVASTGAYTAGATGGTIDVVRVADSLGNVATRSVAVTAGVAVLPGAATVAPRGAQAFTASGGSGTGFTWSLSTNASGGTITAAGLYTAGAIGSVTDVVRVVDSLGNFDTRNVSVSAAVAIVPGALGIPPRGTQAFTATGGSGTGFVWALPTNASGGRISAAGSYTAGATEGTDVVQVTDALGNTATATITVTGRLSITASSTTTPPRGALTFSGAGGSGTGFTWSFASNASGGAISAAGAYVAGATPGVADVVQLTDSFGNTATLSISVGPGVSIAPAVASVLASRSQAFTAAGGSGLAFAWSFATNASGGTISATGTYTAGPVGGVTDVLQVADSLGNTATRSVTVVALPRLSIAKSGPASLAAGASGTFTVTVANLGGSPTTGTLAFQDTLPAGLTFVRQASGAALPCTASASGLVTCSGTPSIAAGANLSVTYTVSVALGAISTVTNSALLTAAGGDPRPLPSTCAAAAPAAGAGSASADGLCARWSTAVRSGQLAVALTLSRVNLQAVPAGYQLAPGDLLEYSVQVTETTGQAGGSVRVTATVPEVTIFTGSGQGWSGGCAGPGTSCTRDFALAAGQTTSALFTVQAAASLPDDLRTLTDAVTAQGAGASCASCSVTTPTAPKLALSMSSPPLLPLGGSSVTTFTIGNRGGSVTSGTMTLVDALPEGLTYTSQLAGAPDLTCTAIGRTVVCTGSPAIPPGGSVEVSVGVAVGARASGDLTSTASLTAMGGDPRSPACDAVVPGAGGSSRSTDGTCAMATGQALSGDAVQFRGSGAGCGCSQGSGGPGLDGLALAAALLLQPALLRRRRRGRA